MSTASTPIGEFDYVIVGAGSAGAALAARLSENPAISVCLLEAGGPDTSALIHAPLGFVAASPLGLNVHPFETVPQPGLNGRKGYAPRGKVLGGSSSVNAMMFVRGHPHDFDAWAALGNPGWDYASVLPFFKRLENSECVGADEFRSLGGPVNAAFLRSPSVLNDAFLAACESQGVARTPDYNGAQMEGCWPTQVSQRNGERCSAAKAYLTPNRGRPNLNIVTRAQAKRVLFKGRRAVGVEFEQGGQLRRVTARLETVLSGGAYGSPQMLMVSGVGPAAHLQALGIPLVHSAPGVGQNLQDHVTSVLIYRSGRRDATMGVSLSGGLALLRGIFEWRRQRTGMITSNVAESGAFLRVNPQAPAPDTELELIVGIVDDHNRKLHLGHGYSLHVTLLHPKSRGQVTLASKDSATPPVIDPRFFDDPDDLPALMAGTRKALGIMEAPALAPFRGPLVYPFDAANDHSLEQHLRRCADTEYHPVGTCKMGPASDASAVVDSRLRVHGLDGLRVIDASIMPTLTSGNTNVPTIMIGEKAAAMMVEDRQGA